MSSQRRNITVTAAVDLLTCGGQPAIYKRNNYRTYSSKVARGPLRTRNRKDCLKLKTSGYTDPGSKDVIPHRSIVPEISYEYPKKLRRYSSYQEFRYDKLRLGDSGISPIAYGIEQEDHIIQEYLEKETMVVRSYTPPTVERYLATIDDTHYYIVGRADHIIEDVNGIRTILEIKTRTVQPSALTKRKADIQAAIYIWLYATASFDSSVSRPTASFDSSVSRPTASFDSSVSRPTASFDSSDSTASFDSSVSKPPVVIQQIEPNGVDECRVLDFCDYLSGDSIRSRIRERSIFTDFEKTYKPALLDGLSII